MAEPGRKQSLSICLGNRLGEFSGRELQAVADVLRDLGVGRVCLTAGRRFLLPGLTPEQAEEVALRLEPLVVQGHDLVSLCAGSAGCRFAQAETSAMGLALERLLHSLDLPAKVKAGVSACAHCCAESLVRDVGLVAKASGWSVYFGGNAGARPRAAELLATGLPGLEALAEIRRVLMIYAARARPKERTARFVERLGIQGLAALGLCADPHGEHAP